MNIRLSAIIKHLHLPVVVKIICMLISFVLIFFSLNIGEYIDLIL